jgi:ankyrin repeat protein
MPHPRSAPTRTLPFRPSLAQLRKQAKELLKSYRSGQQAAVVEVEQFERNTDPTSFALADAQRVLARAYGFPSWTRLKQHVEGLTSAALIAAAAAGDVAAVRRLAEALPELIQPELAEFRDSALHRAVLNRDAEMTRVLMQLGADARRGIWPHRDAASAYAIAKDRQYDEIVSVIEQEEERPRQALCSPGAAIDPRTGEVLAAIRSQRSSEAIRILQSDLSIVGSCDVHGATPLHVAASVHDPELMAWLLAHGAPVDARDAKGSTPLADAAAAAGWSANDRFFPYLKNARIHPARFHEVVQLLRANGAELTSRAAVAIGDREAVTRMHRDRRLKNDVEFWGGGLLTIAVKVNRIDMVSLLLDLGFDPDEPAVPTEDGGQSWGFPLWFAAVCGRHDIAELLLTRGADVNAIFHASGDPLGCAQETHDKKMEALLLQHGARITVEQVSDRETAKAILDGKMPAGSLNVRQPSHTDLAEQMLWAAGPRDPEIVRICLPHMTRRRDDPWWNYVLGCAALPETFKLLLDHGVDADVVGEGGYTILHHLASESVVDEKRVPLATILLDAGASLDKRDPLLRSTPLGWACRWGRTELVRLYLERGADAIELDAESWATPLAWATKSGRDDIVASLRGHGAK